LIKVDAISGFPVHNINTGLNYATIQEAINANETLNGHTILVDAGIYYENVVVNKTISIIGQNKWTTIIDGNNTGEAVDIKSNNAQVSGFTITNGNGANVYIGNNWHQFHYFRVEGVVVKDNLICNSTWGVYVDTGNDGNYVEGNSIQSHSDYGIILVASSDNVIVNNTVVNNHGGVGCLKSMDVVYDWWVPSQNNTIYLNDFIQNTIQAVSEMAWSSTNVWDNGTSGNYWSDYQQRYPNALEVGNSGVWNTTYMIDSDNIDHYPLVNQHNVVSEYPSFQILSLLFITTLLAVIVYRKTTLRQKS
jgi:parallel beta-helix repeat protein